MFRILSPPSLVSSLLPLSHTHTHSHTAKGESSHPTWVYRVTNLHSDRNAKEPGSMVWQSEHILMCSDGTLSHCPHLREAHPCASRTQSFLVHPPTVLFPSRAPHTQVVHPSIRSVTQGSTYLGVPHTAARSSEAVL